MTDTELITAIENAVERKTKDLREEIKDVNTRIDNMDKKFAKQNEKIMEKLNYVDEKFSKRTKDLDKKVTDMDIKFSVQLGQTRCQIDDLHKGINYLKQQPYYADSRLSLLEGQQDITNKRLDILEAKRA